MTTWRFWIDRGGTFTDCVALSPNGALHTAKLLSSDEAPVAALRRVLAQAEGAGADAPLPPCSVKLGTTVATNALLERRGAATALVTNEGLGDLLRIGTQQRPDLFALEIRKPAPLHRRVLELAGRSSARGETLEALDPAAARRALAALHEEGIEALAIVGVHATVDAHFEDALAKIAREVGFSVVVRSARASGEAGMLARGETAVTDAYLAPLLEAHRHALAQGLPGAHLRFMQSSGGLTEGARFRGSRALLSGPAGGAVGAAQVAAQAGFTRAIAFDMGGTSTDVCLVVDGETEQAFESEVAGVRVRAPMLKIHTVAAGGGSLCRFDGFRLTVGPESAGARPGPLCYGRPEARELALTDINAFLGRVRPERFPLPMETHRAAAALEEMSEALAAAGHARSPEELAAGFIEVANAGMVQAIRQVSVARGVDPRDFALVGFGGAAGQHVCAVARQLGIGVVLLHPLAGLLSAYGIGMARPRWDGERDAGGAPLSAGAGLAPELDAALAELEAEGREALCAEGAAQDSLRATHRLDLRYRGSESALTVTRPSDGDWAAAFSRTHRAHFGYERSGRPLEVVTARVTVRSVAAEAEAIPQATPAAQTTQAVRATPAARATQSALAMQSGAQQGARSQARPALPAEASAWFPGAGRLNAALLERERLSPGERIEGPAILLEDSGTVLIDPGFVAEVREGGLLRLSDQEADAARRAPHSAHESQSAHDHSHSAYDPGAAHESKSANAASTTHESHSANAAHESQSANDHPHSAHAPGAAYDSRSSHAARESNGSQSAYAANESQSANDSPAARESQSAYAARESHSTPTAHGAGDALQEADASPQAETLQEADPVRLEVFGNRFMSIAEQMGAVLRNTALSTNIKERLDYSCAVFDVEGGLVANAPHIPVHLGAMGATVRAVKQAFPRLEEGDAVVTNDPAAGGSHLPDITVVMPVFIGSRLSFFTAARGHHADIGGVTPGSMPAHSTRLEEEGVVLHPFLMVRRGVFLEQELRARLQGAPWPARRPDDNVADLEALAAACRTGEALLHEMVAEVGLSAVRITMTQLQQAAAAKVSREIARIGDGEHVFEDALDDGTPLRVRLAVRGGRMCVDFSGSGAALAGNLNAPRAVVESAVIYVLRCLVAEPIPLNGGCLLPVEIVTKPGSLLDPPPGAAVVGGNVETSQRIVDVLLGAIGRVAAGQGTMNNLAFGDAGFAYYETIGGGAGAGEGFHGASGVHVHMTNTRITDPEVLETRTPVIVRRFALREGSGGAGRFRGGDGLVRELEFTAPVQVSLLCERRTRAPFGLAGGAPGAPGVNRVLYADGRVSEAPGHARLTLEAGDRLRIETPGGGGYGRPPRS